MGWKRWELHATVHPIDLRTVRTYAIEETGGGGGNETVVDLQVGTSRALLDKRQVHALIVALEQTSAGKDRKDKAYRSVRKIYRDRLIREGKLTETDA